MLLGVNATVMPGSEFKRSAHRAFDNGDLIVDFSCLSAPCFVSVANQLKQLPEEVRLNRGLTMYLTREELNGKYRWMRLSVLKKIEKSLTGESSSRDATY